MSVLDRLKELSGEEHEPMERFTDVSAGGDEMQGMEEMMQSVPVPGQSLTQDPESRLPYEQPPKYTDVQEFIDETFLQLSDPDGLPQLLDVMRSDMPVEDLAQKYLMKAFQEGQINPDVLMLAIEPTIYILISLATYANIDPVLYPEDDMVEDTSLESQTTYFRQASQDMLNEESEDEAGQGVTIDDINSPAVQPKSLLSRAKKAVSQIETKGNQGKGETN